MPHTKADKPRLLTLLVLLLVSVLAVLAIIFDAVIVSLASALAGHLKFLFNLLWPKSILLFIKNGALVNLKNYIIKVFSVVLIHGYRPWRRRLRKWSEIMVLTAMALWRRYRRSSLWVQMVVAAGLLLFTIGTGYSFFAVFALPSFILKWIRDVIRAILDRLGVATIFKRLWERVCPVSINHRIKLLLKWRVGRFQINMARKLRQL